MEGNEKLIIDSILEESAAFAERTEKAAQKEAEAMLAAARADAAAVKQALLSGAEKQLAEKKERILAAARLDGKKQILEEKQRLLAQVIDMAVEKIISLPDQEYLAVIERMLVGAVSENIGVSDHFAVIVSPLDKQRISGTFVERVNRSLNAAEFPAFKQPLDWAQKMIVGAFAGGSGERLTENFVKKAGKQLQGITLTGSEEQRDIGPGFILQAGRIEINCTFAAIVRSRRDALEELAARILFS